MAESNIAATGTVSQNRAGRSAPAVRLVDQGLDLAVVMLAAGAVAYHLALLFDLSRDTLGAIWLGLGTSAAYAVVRIDRESSASSSVLAYMPPTTVRAVAVGALAAAGLFLASGSAAGWWLFWTPSVIVLFFGARSATARPSPASDNGRRSKAMSGATVVLLLAVGLGFASLVTNRPDLDDVYLVNRSVYVEEHSGRVPTQDVLFDDRKLPGERAPLRSPAIEALVGVVAAVLPVRSATVAYLGLAPLASALSVLAVWRLARTLSCARPLLVVVGAVAFVLLDGSRHASFGNFSFGRAWQGKVILTAVVVPLLWCYAVRWGRDGSRRHLFLLVAANVAAVGLSSTGLFVAPFTTFVVSTGVAVVTRSIPRLAAAGGAALYPLALAVFNRATDSGLQEISQEATRTLAPWSRWSFVVGRPASVICAAAVVLAWLTVNDRASRMVLSVAPLLTIGLLYGPRVLDPLRLFAPGAVSILWRAIWVLPVPALVGMTMTAPLAVGPASRKLFTAVLFVVAAATGMFALMTTPVMSTHNSTSLGRPMWKTGGNVQVAERLVEEAAPGTRVAGPFDVDRVVPLLTSTIRAVDPRPGWYTTGVDPLPRQLIQRGLTSGIGDDEVAAFEAALSSLDVDVVALPTALREDPAARTLERAGFELRGLEDDYLILKRKR